MAEDVREQVFAIVAEQAVLDVSELRPETTLAEIGIDSLALVEIVFAIEETFDIQVPFNANEPQKSPFDVSTVGSIVAGVEKLLAERP